MNEIILDEFNLSKLNLSRWIFIYQTESKLFRFPWKLIIDKKTGYYEYPKGKKITDFFIWFIRFLHENFLYGYLEISKNN